jgi:tetratricopeptide (TPR) repeat protein
MKRIGLLLLLSGCASGITGASVLAVAKPNLIEQFEFRSVDKESKTTSLPDTNWGEFSICRSPSVEHATRGMIRLALVEVQPGGLQAIQSAPEFADSDPPLWEGLGSITYKITTANPEAQGFFDQGLRLAFAFNHDEARRAFRKAQRLDPECAMCFWGEALVLGPNINLPMPQDAVPLAFAAIKKAEALAPKARLNEQALIASLSKRYEANATPDRAALDAAYAAAMAEVAAQFPDDNEIAVLYAESVMDLSPWDYWQPGGAAPKPQSAPIVSTLERVLARTPDHPGAIHYYIHAVEASDRPQRAEPYADRLRGAIPNGGHLVHMPSHIYLRVGRYFDALKDNKVAAAVDETYLATTRAPMGIYRLGYYPHNVHFVLAAAQMAGDGPTVIASAEKLQAIIPDEVAIGIPQVHPVKAATYFAHAQFSTPDTILALPNPGDRIPYVKAMWHYARGIARAANRDFPGAAAEADAIAELQRTTDFTPYNAALVPAQDVFSLAQVLVMGRLAQAQGDSDAAIARFEQAAALQDGLPYMEPPYWYYPVRQTLGAELIRAGRLADAEDQFKRALRRAPNNGWSYFGLAELYKARGASDQAQQMQQQLSKTWAGDLALLQLSRL